MTSPLSKRRENGKDIDQHNGCSERRKRIGTYGPLEEGEKLRV